LVIHQAYLQAEREDNHRVQGNYFLEFLTAQLQT
jgi:hypothetical protein